MRVGSVGVRGVFACTPAGQLHCFLFLLSHMGDGAGAAIRAATFFPHVAFCTAMPLLLKR